MADFNGNLISYTNNGQSSSAPGGTSIVAPDYTNRAGSSPGGLAYIPFGEPGDLVYYKMRALRDPLGSGFVSWTVLNNPDPDGNEAPDPIVIGSAVIMASWIG